MTAGPETRREVRGPGPIDACAEDLGRQRAAANCRFTASPSSITANA